MLPLALRIGDLSMGELPGDFPNSRRHGDADCLKHLAADSPAFGPDSKSLPAFFHGDHLEGLEILPDIGPLEVVSGSLDASEQFLSRQDGSVKKGPRFSVD